MTPLEELKSQIELLTARLNAYELSDRFMMNKTFQLMDGRNIQLGKGTGTKIGTEPTQKLAFFGHAPVVQQPHINAAIANGATYNQSDVNSIGTATNSVISALTALGFIA
jgi:hypothetical protein